VQVIQIDDHLEEAADRQDHLERLQNVGRGRRQPERADRSRHDHQPKAISPQG